MGARGRTGVQPRERERVRGRITVKGTQREEVAGQRRDRGRGVRPGPGRGSQKEEEEGGVVVRSEYGGLILSADCALGFLGVHEPSGAALRLSVPLLVHHVPLQRQKNSSIYWQVIISNTFLIT